MTSKQDKTIIESRLQKWTHLRTLDWDVDRQYKYR